VDVLLKPIFENTALFHFFSSAVTLQMNNIKRNTHHTNISSATQEKRTQLLVFFYCLVVSIFGNGFLQFRLFQ